MFILKYRRICFETSNKNRMGSIHNNGDMLHAANPTHADISR